MPRRHNAIASTIGVSVVLCVFTLFSGLAWARQQPAAPERRTVATSAPIPSHATQVLVRTQRPDGRPFKGAYVVTSEGGRAVSDPAGVASLTIELPADAEAIQVTAALTLGAVNHVGSVRVTDIVRGGVTDAGVVTLTDGAVCEPSWLPSFGGRPGVNDAVHAMAVYDDGDGPSLIVGGAFTTAGGVQVNHIAAWDGRTWSALAEGLNGPARALAVYDDGSGDGPALFVGGEFSRAGEVTARRIAMWNGETWAPVGAGMNRPVLALEVFDDGRGPALYAAGAFTRVGRVGARRIARWDGQNWTLPAGGADGPIHTLQAGAGALYVGGDFTTAGDARASGVARWDGRRWSGLAGGVDGPVRALAIAETPEGAPILYAGGDFTRAGAAEAAHLARWDGQRWSPLAEGVDGPVDALALADAGDGPVLHVGGRFNAAGGAPAANVARWDGQRWSPLAEGVSGGVNAFALFAAEDDARARLYTAGAFTDAAGVYANFIAHWDGRRWSTLGDGISGTVFALATFDEELYAGGRFTSIGGVAANHIARWDGQRWRPVGEGLDAPVNAMVAFNDGDGAALYVGGYFTSAGEERVDFIARWDGETWSPLAGGMNSAVDALAVYNDGDGPALYAGGYFTTAGGVNANRVAKWDGQQWSALGRNPENLSGPGMDLPVLALTVFDDGTGPALIAGGRFFTAGGVSARRIAKWDGETWSPLAAGMDGGVSALAVYTDADGPSLIAGGDFTRAGAVSAKRIAQWNGLRWSPMGGGMGGQMLPRVEALAVYDDGGKRGPSLYAGGYFTRAGAVNANRIARWDGRRWLPLDDGVDRPVHALLVRDDDSDAGEALLAAGAFAVSPAGDSHIARWLGCAGHDMEMADLNEDELVDALDLADLLARWGDCPDPEDCPADMNFDGVVDTRDMQLLLGRWNAAPDG